MNSEHSELSVKDKSTTTNATPNIASRRKFITRASAGIVIASIPARSVWATGGGVAQSIIASGHGSDFAEGEKIKLLSPGYWKNHMPSNHALNFSIIFGGKAFDKNGMTNLASSTTFGQILNTKGSTLKGISNVNFHMVAMYLNAVNSGTLGLNFPVIGPGKPFATASQFASYLYNKAKANPSAIGVELSNLITQYHA